MVDEDGNTRATTHEALEQRYALQLNFEETLRAMPTEERLAHILSSNLDGEAWFDPLFIETFAEFYHNKLVFGSIKARAKAAGVNQRDVELAVEAVIRQQSRVKLLQAMHGDPADVTPDEVIANFTEAEWIEEQTLQFLARYYNDAPSWMRIKIAAKKAGINPFDLDKAVKQVAARTQPLGQPAPSANSSQPVLANGLATDWTQLLQVNSRGQPEADMANIHLILRNDDTWQNRFWWDEIRSLPMLDQQPITALQN
jgi:hypothetical protein